MSDQAASEKAESRKPTKALPTDRASFPKQIEILGAYGAIGATEGVTSTAVAKVVGAHLSTVSVCNSFLAESGLVVRSGMGYQATPEVVAYHGAIEWDAETAGHKLAPIIRETWYWKALQPRLSFKPLETEDAIRILAEDCKAGTAYRAQIALTIEYLILAGLVVRDGSLLRKGPTASGGHPAPLAPPGGQEIQAAPAEQPQATVEKAPVALPGIVFDASIRITEKEIGTWAPDQIREFFAGLAAVISAKAKNGT